MLRSWFRDFILKGRGSGVEVDEGWLDRLWRFRASTETELSLSATGEQLIHETGRNGERRAGSN